MKKKTNEELVSEAAIKNCTDVDNAPACWTKCCKFAPRKLLRDLGN